MIKSHEPESLSWQPTEHDFQNMVINFEIISRDFTIMKESINNLRILL